MVQDQYLTENFTLYQLTKTSVDRFQERNRDVNEIQIEKLTQVARLLEHVMFMLGTKITVTSGYRCPDLNKAVGSSDRSQHMFCEAADFVPDGQDLPIAFRALWRDIKDNNTNVGQLIFETAVRPYGIASWLHISLGAPYRKDIKNKQILRMLDGEYERLA